MPVLEGLKNIGNSYAIQLRVRGALFSRLDYVTRYWAYYFAQRRGGASRSWAEAHLYAMRRLADSGRSHRLVRVRTPDGARLEIDLFTCHMILADTYCDRVYEFEDVRPARGQVVFDVGGQQGTFTIRAAKIVGPSGKVVSIEPEPRNFSQIKKNIRLNALGNVVALQAALSDRPGSAVLHLSSWNLGGHSLTPGGDASEKAVSVRVRTLDEISEELRLVPDFVKIDVEGAALAVLHGGLKTIRTHKPNIALEWESEGERKKIEAFFAENGYASRRRERVLFGIPV